MNRILKSMFLAGLLAPAGQAMAQEADTGFYAGANVGVAFLGDADVTVYADGGTFGGTGTEDTIGSTFDNGSALTFGGVTSEPNNVDATRATRARR